MILKMVSWNINRLLQPWEDLGDMDCDVALLQEAGYPPSDVSPGIEAGPGPWKTPGEDGWRLWRTAVVKLSDRVTVEWLEGKSLLDATATEWAVSRPHTLSVARITAPGLEPIVVASMYALWTGLRAKVFERSGGITADAAAHRLISDLSVFMDRQRGHRILAAGDLNVLYGYGDYGDAYWAGRYETVFARMEACGLRFVGPQAPHGHQADPWPEELPFDSKNVPTYRQHGSSATRQLDFVFASADLADSVSVRALNHPDEWGPSDHCRVEITVS